MGDRDHDGEETFVNPNHEHASVGQKDTTQRYAAARHSTPSQRGPEGYDPNIRCTRMPECTPTVIVPYALVSALRCSSIIAPYR